MSALFPTFTTLGQRLKRLLATDIIPVWQRFLDTCDADEDRYISECRAKGLDFLI
ncbi:MAG TPA: hypothetical protein V6D11_07695 [Waterburya sp.]|jgi:hypothetical protein